MPIFTLDWLRWRTLVVAGPVSWVLGSALVGADGRWIRYVPLAAAGIVMIAALVVGTTTVVPSSPLTTCASGHGFLTRMSRAAGPLPTAAVVITPSWTWTWTFERCVRATGPAAFHP